MKKLGKVLLTGAAGFIGFHMAKRLLDEGYRVVGFDNMNDYYAVKLKEDRLNLLLSHPEFLFVKGDLADQQALFALFSSQQPDIVLHLAAQTGVRYSIENPQVYVDSNLVGFMNVLEACRHFPVEHLLYASSSSVYGGNRVVPFSTEHSVDHPISLYAATKKSNELMAHAYSHLYGIPTTGLRFFTVYGPWGRPDMAYFSFTKKILAGEAISVFNHGQMERDFTYVDDVVEGVFRLMSRPPQANPDWHEDTGLLSESTAAYKLYNIGNSSPVRLETFIALLESAIGLQAEKQYMDMQAGDVLTTYADVEPLQAATGFHPSRDLGEGLKRFVEWYREYYQV